MIGSLGLDGPFRQPASCVIESAPGKAIQNLDGVLTLASIDISRNCLLYTSPSPRDRG